MGIRIRHDAAAVALPSINASGQKYGQQLVLQQQQQKYQGQQAGYDRLLTLGRDQQQRTFQGMRDIQQNNWQTQRDLQQNAFQGARDKALMEQKDQEQRRADFSAARGRIDAYAKDVLSDPELPQELRQRIQNLVSGKMIALGGGFDGPAQQEFLDQYNAQLAAILSEIPPKQPKPPPQPNFHTDENGNKWVESGPSKWEQVPQQPPQPPASAGEAFKANPKEAEKYLTDADSYLTEGGMVARPSSGRKDAEGKDIPMSDEEYRRARNELAKKLYDIDQESFGGGKQSSPTGFGTSSAAYYNAPDSEVKPTASPEGMPIASPDPGRPPSPVPVAPATSPPASDAESAIREARLAAQMGYEPRVDSSGKPFWYKDDKSQAPQVETPSVAGQSPATQRQPLPLTSNSRSQNPWSETASADQLQQSTPPMAANRTEQSVPASEAPKAPKPDFDKLVSGAQDDDDRAVLGGLQSIYASQPPEVQSVIDVLVSPDSDPKEKASAAAALRDAGIDLNQLAPPPPPPKRKGVQGNKHRDWQSGKGL